MIIGARYAYRQISASTTCLYVRTRARNFPRFYFYFYSRAGIEIFSRSRPPPPTCSSCPPLAPRRASPPPSRQLAPRRQCATARRETERRAKKKKINQTRISPDWIESFGITKSRHSNSSVTMTADRNVRLFSFWRIFSEARVAGDERARGGTFSLNVFLSVYVIVSRRNKGRKGRGGPM